MNTWSFDNVCQNKFNMLKTMLWTHAKKMFSPTFKIKTSSSIGMYEVAWLLILQANILMQKETATISNNY